jgi:hypothetical protein
MLGQKVFKIDLHNKYMKKRKVLSSFAVLLIFAGILLALQIRHFGSLTGQAILGSMGGDSFGESIENNTITSLSVAEEQDNPSVIVAIVVIAGILLLIFITRYILAHHNRTMHGVHKIEGRKLIKLDLD